MEPTNAPCHAHRLAACCQDSLRTANVRYLMGCDFQWRGAIPNLAVQEKAIQFLAPAFNPGIRVRPESAQAPMLVLGPAGQVKFEPGYPFAFNGLIPPEECMGRGQFIF